MSQNRWLGHPTQACTGPFSRVARTWCNAFAMLVVLACLFLVGGCASKRNRLDLNGKITIDQALESLAIATALKDPRLGEYKSHEVIKRIAGDSDGWMRTGLGNTDFREWTWRVEGTNESLFVEVSASRYNNSPWKVGRPTVVPGNYAFFMEKVYQEMLRQRAAAPAAKDGVQ